MRKVERVLSLADDLMDRARRLLAAFHTAPLNVDGLQAAMDPLETEASRALDLSGNEKLPPLACAECDLAFRCMALSMHDVFGPFTTAAMDRHGLQGTKPG